MHINQIRISQILGIEHLEFEAGKFNEVSGENGVGKTSFLEAIKSAVRGGDDATLLRRGAERGEIVLVLDDNTEIRRRITQKATTTTVERNGVKVQRPAEVIKGLTDMLSINPVDFLRAPKKLRVNALLESLPMAVDAERIAGIVGREVELDESAHALEQISALHKSIFDDRTGTNRAVREKEATINQLAATLPDGETDDVPADKSGLLATLNGIDAKKDAEIERISTKLDGFRKGRDDAIAALRSISEKKVSDWQDEIAALQKKIADEKVSVAADILAESDKFADVERKAGQQREITLKEHAEEREDTAAKLKSIEEHAAQATKHQQTRDTIKAMREAADTLREDADRQTAALEALEAYKSELLSALPIDGLSVVDGEIFRHEIPFDRLNSGQQVEIAVEIAKLRAGPLGIICVDGIELLDAKHFESFKEQALASDLQLFVAKVGDSEMELTAEA
jgi:DNA repair exonuclease SbcCD ATPase subunit